MLTYPLKAYIFAFIAGLVSVLGFAPFHLPGALIIGIAILFYITNKYAKNSSLLLGLFYGIGYFGGGVSWVYISIHNYGHLNSLLSSIITALFVFYLSIFPAIMSWIYRSNNEGLNAFQSSFLFTALWVLFEYMRSHLLSGFPWLIVAYSSMDLPFRHLLPIIGTYGVSAIIVFLATLLPRMMRDSARSRIPLSLTFLGLILVPFFFKSHVISTDSQTPLKVSIIQQNLSMRDKWDESLFNYLLKSYDAQIRKVITTSNLVVLPESAIPAPSSYVGDVLRSWDNLAEQNNAAILLGIPLTKENQIYNGMIALGDAYGEYKKRHLVIFGEWIPKPFVSLMQWLNIPLFNMTEGKTKQPLVDVKGYSIASLICYELAYPELLRSQLPEASFIVSMSDDGWFGHSLASYQQLQIAQVLSALSNRYQVVANNDGLSSIIDSHGSIIKSLQPFTTGILAGDIYTVTGITPWGHFGDTPALFLTILTLFTFTLRRFWLYRKNIQLDTAAT